MHSENGERRINTWVTTGAALALGRLAQHHACSRRAMLERLILTADNEIVHRLEPLSAEWDAYFKVTQ